MLDLIILITCLIVAYLTGNYFEKKHYESIRKREVALFKKKYINFAKKTFSASRIKTAVLVSGNIVIGCDYFKMFVAGLKSLFGGNISAYESVLDRGRREAILRMREQAEKIGAHAIVNTKIETVLLSSFKARKSPQVSILAYGTAIKYVKS